MTLKNGAHPWVSLLRALSAKPCNAGSIDVEMYGLLGGGATIQLNSVSQKGCFRPEADIEGELLRMLAKTIYAANVSTLAS